MTAPTDQPPTAWDPAPLPAPGPSGWTPAPSEGRPLPQQQTRPSVPFATSAYVGSPVRRGGLSRRTAAWLVVLGLVIAVGLIGYRIMATPSGPASFAVQGETGRMTISWIDDGTGDLNGSMQMIVPDEADADVPSNFPLTGTLHSGQVSVTFSAGLLGNATYLGTVSGDQLVLNFPNDDGTSFTRTLTRTVPRGTAERMRDWVNETLRFDDRPEPQLDN